MKLIIDAYEKVKKNHELDNFKDLSLYRLGLLVFALSLLALGLLYLNKRFFQLPHWVPITTALGAYLIAGYFVLARYIDWKAKKHLIVTTITWSWASVYLSMTLLFFYAKSPRVEDMPLFFLFNGFYTELTGRFGSRYWRYSGIISIILAPLFATGIMLWGEKSLVYPFMVTIVLLILVPGYLIKREISKSVDIIDAKESINELEKLTKYERVIKIFFIKFHDHPLLEKMKDWWKLWIYYLLCGGTSFTLLHSNEFPLFILLMFAIFLDIVGRFASKVLALTGWVIIGLTAFIIAGKHYGIL